jgi:hypothetical protein
MLELFTASAEAASESTPWPLIVGGTVFLVLMAMLFALLAFGAGREHS